MAYMYIPEFVGASAVPRQVGVQQGNGGADDPCLLQARHRHTGRRYNLHGQMGATENVNFISLLNFQTEIVRRTAVDSRFKFIQFNSISK